MRQRLQHGKPSVDTDASTGHKSPGTLNMSPSMSPLLPHGTPRSTVGSPLTGFASRRSEWGQADVAAGPRRHSSLSEVEILPWLCCMTPAICIFMLYGTVLITSIFFEKAFYVLTAVLTVIAMMWVSNLALSSLYGAYLIRKDTRVDWNALLEETQDQHSKSGDDFDVMHIVILPNYKEAERMLQDTLENLGSSPMALDRVRVVLAMEAREGPAAREKAERLLSKCEHLFADIFATYHPENLPGEVPGKSSNTQWAFREALRHYGPILQGCDLTRVFLTVGDADTLWHPQYFSAMSYSGMNMTGDQRTWTIWQPPILLLRNIFTVPAMTRSSAHATLIFEIAGLANQFFFPAFAYSSYSLTLALACHPEVDGWDVDVIAEDHHMFCKCYFAAMWESAHILKEAEVSGKNPEDICIAPQVKVQPIFLPAVSYLVESDGYLSSLHARFQQARRHSQGVVELGYVLLQYARLADHSSLPRRTHMAIICIVVKLHTLHITATAQCFALIMAGVTKFTPSIFRWITAGGMTTILGQVLKGEFRRIVTEGFDNYGALDAAQQAMAASVGQISGVSVLYSFTCFIVMRDLIEGEYYKVLGRPNIVGAMPPVGEDATGEATAEAALPDEDKENEKEGARETEGKLHQGAPSETSDSRMPSFCTGTLSAASRLALFLQIFNDTVCIGYTAMFFFAMIPACCAAWSLFRRGTDFEYIVAAKPEN